MTIHNSSSHGFYTSKFPHGLMFHRFHPDGDKSNWQGALSENEFEQILLYVGIDNILTPDEWIKFFYAGELSNNSFCITFDDGLSCQYNIALPVLKRYGLKAFWFIYTSIFSLRPVKLELYSIAASFMGGMNVFVDKYLSIMPCELKSHLDTHKFRKYLTSMKMEFPFYSLNDIKFRYLRNAVECKEIFEVSVESFIHDHGINLQDIARSLWIDQNQLNELAHDGHYIGLHSHTHPYAISHCDKYEQYNEYKLNYDTIYEITKIKPISMSHPLNSYNEDTLRILKTLGIKCGFRSNMIHNHCEGDIPGYLEQPREDSANLLKMYKG